MAQSACGLGLAPESLDELLTVGLARNDHLQSHEPLRAQVTREIHRSHAALAELPVDGVFAVEHEAGHGARKSHTLLLGRVVATECPSAGRRGIGKLEAPRSRHPGAGSSGATIRVRVEGECEVCRCFCGVSHRLWLARTVGAAWCPVRHVGKLCRRVCILRRSCPIR